jgi:hypothetical protein
VPGVRLGLIVDPSGIVVPGTIVRVPGGGTMVDGVRMPRTLLGGATVEGATVVPGTTVAPGTTVVPGTTVAGGTVL